MPAGESDWRAMLRRERALLGLTQAGLGRGAGLSAETVRKYEAGARTPTRGHLVAILDVLQVPQLRAREILAAAGFAAADRLFPPDGHPGYYFTLAEARAEIEDTPWPQFVVGDQMEILAANRAASLLWGADVDAEVAGRPRPELHFLSLMAEPRIAGRIANFDECLAMAVGVLKGVPGGGADLRAPGPWVDRVLGAFAASDPSAVAGLLRAWEATPPRPAKSRWTYPLVWREPEGEIRLTGLVSTASEPDGLAFNDWLPADAESHAVLERVLAARAVGRRGAVGRRPRRARTAAETVAAPGSAPAGSRA